MKRAALGNMALGYKSAKDEFREAVGVEAMNDTEVRRRFADGTLNKEASVEALRRAGRSALADELEQEYLSEPSPEEPSANDEPSAVEPSASEASGSDDSSDGGEGSVESSVSKFAVHDGAGWYSLSDSDEKMRGKQNVLDAGYEIAED